MMLPETWLVFCNIRTNPFRVLIKIKCGNVCRGLGQGVRDNGGSINGANISLGIVTLAVLYLNFFC